MLTRNLRSVGKEALRRPWWTGARSQLDLHKLTQEAPLPVMPTPQVNVSLVNSLEALTGLIEIMWNPEARPPPDQLIHAIQESRAILQTSSAILSQAGGTALEAEAGVEQDPELWDQDDDEDEAEEVEGFEEARAPRRADGGGEAGHSRRRREPQSWRCWRKGAVHFHRSNFYQREPCRIPGTRNETRLRNEHVRSSQPWQVPEILPPFHLHTYLVLLPCASRETPADLP